MASYRSFSFIPIAHDSAAGHPLALPSSVPAASRRLLIVLRRRRSSQLIPLRAADPASIPGGGQFLSPDDLPRLELLSRYTFSHDFLSGGRLLVRPLSGDEDADQVVSLLSSSFSETVSWAPAKRYAQLLAFLVRQYVAERRRVAPHAAVLVGYYGSGGEEQSLVCTAEVTFDALGAPAAPPTPTPPPACPYICNMTVKASMRRKGIGTILLKACEDLVTKMGGDRRVYLHCRVVDSIPFNMYRKAGYRVVQTDSFLIWLSLQRRKHLMCKELPSLNHDGNSITVALPEVP